MNFSKKDSKLLTSSLNETVYLENNFSLISSHKSQVLAVHGMATYAGWFEGLSEKLAEDKIVTNTFDLPAFGRSGKRGELKSHKQWIEATTLAWQDAVARSPKEMFLLGHSLGAVVSMASLPFLEPKPKGIILTVPGFSANYKTFDLWEFVLPTFLKGLLDLPDKTSFPLAEEVYESIQKGIHSPDF
jgi:alpha-beta hydrolase superfamily lysophospholipase